MILDALAWAVLVAVYLFGGAALFFTDRARYRDVLLGWAALNAFVLCVAAAFAACWWAIGRVLT